MDFESGNLDEGQGLRAGLIPSRGSITKTEMCAHEITDRYGGRPVTPGSSDRFYSQLLLLPPCLNSVFSPLRKGRKFSQITTSHMASASSASMVFRWVSLVTCGLLRVGNGGLMREL